MMFSFCPKRIRAIPSSVGMRMIAVNGLLVIISAIPMMIKVMPRKIVSCFMFC